MNKRFILKDFIIITLITSIWVNISELIRYFAYVRPEMIEYFPSIQNMGEIWNFQILLVWGFFDTLLVVLYVFLFWLSAQVFGNNRKSILISGFMSWSFFFVLFGVESDGIVA